jgi:hypothetical protein
MRAYLTGLDAIDRNDVIRWKDESVQTLEPIGKLNA